MTLNINILIYSDILLIIGKKFMIKKGYTLAEVLITLTVLGVIAVILIPGIVNKIQDRITVAKVQRYVGIINNILERIYVTEPPFNSRANSSYADRFNNDKYFVDLFKNNLKGAQIITDRSYHGYKNLWGRPSYIIDFHYQSGQGTYFLKLKDGGLLSIKLTDPKGYTHPYCGSNRNCTMYGVILIDINGKKGKNRLGYDIFAFTFGPPGINLYKPEANDNGGNAYYSTKVPGDCNFMTGSSDSALAGLSCGFWIMRHKNMNYKYKNVSSEW